MEIKWPSKSKGEAGRRFRLKSTVGRRMKLAKHGGIEIEDENENEIEEAKLKERKFHFVWNWGFFSEEILGIHERIRIPLPLHHELQTRFHLLLLLLVSLSLILCCVIGGIISQSGRWVFYLTVCVVFELFACCYFGVLGKLVGFSAMDQNFSCWVGSTFRPFRLGWNFLLKQDWESGFHPTGCSIPPF